jgi:hypothetical protein
MTINQKADVCGLDLQGTAVHGEATAAIGQGDLCGEYYPLGKGALDGRASSLSERVKAAAEVSSLRALPAASI